MIHQICLVLLSFSCIAASEIVTYSAYGDSYCGGQAVATLTFTSGQCTYDSASGMSAVVNVTGDLVLNEFYSGNNCAGTGQLSIFARAVCVVNGNSGSFKFVYAYTPVSNINVVYWVYTDSSCTTLSYNLTIPEGVCTNDVASGSSGITILEGNTAVFYYFNGLNCAGSGYQSDNFQNGVCQSSTGSFKFTWSTAGTTGSVGTTGSTAISTTGSDNDSGSSSVMATSQIVLFLLAAFAAYL